MKQDSAGTLDLIIEELGQWGKYNVLMYGFIFVPILFTGIYASQYVFIAGDINYRCQISECEHKEDNNWISWAIPSTGNNSDKCSQFLYIDDNSTKCTSDSFDRNKTLNCDRYIYDEENTIVKEFDLGCKEWKRTLVGSLHNAGFFISISITGILSDRFGRKTCLITAALITGVIGVMRSFSISYTMFIVLEFLETAIGGGIYTCAFILLIEIVTPKYRVMINSLLNIMFSTGCMLPAVLLWAIPDWKLSLRIMYIPAIIMIAYIWIIDESVRWLLAKGKNEDAIKILRKAAKINNIELSDALLTKLENKENTRKNSQSMENEFRVNNGTNVNAKTIFMQVLSSRVLVTRLCLCSFIWITCTFVYYGMSIHSTSLSGNKYTNFILVCLVEIPSHIVAMFVVERIGRRLTLNITLISAGICCISQAYVSKDLQVVSLLVYLSGKFFITLAYECFYVFVTEVFPTTVRQSLVGCCSTMGRLGSVLAPQVPIMAIYMESLPSLLFGGMALASGFLSLTMPETTNQKLPDTIEEAEEISSKKT